MQRNNATHPASERRKRRAASWNSSLVGLLYRRKLESGDVRHAPVSLPPKTGSFWMSASVFEFGTTWSRPPSFHVEMHEYGVRGKSRPFDNHLLTSRDHSR